MKTIRFLLFTLLAGVACMADAATVTFAGNSQMTAGKWVKIGTPRNGVYEISYSRLRQMGFSDPAKVKVWGEGGVMYDRNFINPNTQSRLIPDSMPQVACWHHGDKLYFYGRGPENITWEKDDSFDAGGLFCNSGLNIYTSQGIYFLTDQGADMPVTALGCQGTVSGTPLDRGYGYYYHEKDVTQGDSHSGQTFWGEDFASDDKLRQSFPYSAPGVIDTLPGAVNIRFNGRSWGASRLYMTLDGNQYASAYIEPRPDQYTYVMENSVKRFSTPSLKATGSLELFWSQISLWQAQAYLDYFLFTYPRRLEFQDGEKQFAVLAPVNEASSISLPRDPGLAVWDVSDYQFPRYLEPDAATGVAMLPQGSRQLVFFRTSETQLEPRVIGDVSTEDFRARLLNENPEYIILTTEEFRPHAEKLADFHRFADGLSISVVTNEECYNSFSAGRPDPMAYRAMLRMAYDKGGNRLRGVLLYGPQRSDIRGLNSPEAPDALIVYQNPSADRVATSIALTDIYGIFSDCLKNYVETEQMSIAVATMPVVSASEADRYYDKVVRYSYDDSRAYWLERALFTADDKDSNSHLEQSNILAGELQTHSGNNLTLDKVHLGEYGYPGVKQPLFDAFNEGVSLAEYIGHGSLVQLGHDAAILNPSDIGSFRNRRLPVMTIASCETALYEIGQRGLADHLVLSTDNGLVGSLGTVRTAFAGDNLAFMRNFNRMAAKLCDASTGTPEQLGEIVRRTKNETTGYMGKYKFHLISDPMLRLARPTMKVVMTAAPDVAAPGADYTLQGRVATPSGSSSADFSGDLVVKWYAPAYSKKADSKVAKDPGNVMMTYDHTLEAVQAFSVTGGRFSVTAKVPTVMRQFIGDTVRVTAVTYDADKCVGGSWAGLVVISENGSGSVPPDTQAPVVDVMQAEGMAGGEMLPSEFILVAEATDDTGIRIDEKAMDGPLALSLDGRQMPTGVASHIRLEDGARKLLLRYPLNGLSAGRHSLMLTLTDYVGNVTRREFSFEVGSSEAIAAPLLSEGACRDQATFTLPAEVQSAVSSVPELVITDARGRIVVTQAWKPGADGHVWGLEDDKGNAVAPGLYKAYVRFVNAKGRSAVTRGAYVPVLTRR